jgi:hypothetical protein
MSGLCHTAAKRQMPVSAPMRPARHDGTARLRGARDPRCSLASKPEIVNIRVCRIDDPRTAESKDSACRKVRSIFQRASRRARAVPSLSVTPPPPAPPGSPTEDPQLRSSPACPGLFTFAWGTDRSLSATRLARLSVRLPVHRAFLTNCGFLTTGRHMSTPALAGSLESTPIRTDKLLD